MTTHLLFTLFIVLSSGGLVYVFVKGLLEKARHFDEAVRAIRQWPSTMGHITRSQVLRETEAINGSTRIAYRPAIEYRYIVQGVRYFGNRIKLGPTINYLYPDHAMQQLTHYPLNQAVTVYYNPANPSDALLRQNQEDASQYRSGAYALIFFWLCIVSITVFGMVAAV